MEASHARPEVLIPEVVDSNRRRSDPGPPRTFGEVDRPTRWAAAVVVVAIALAALAIVSVVAVVLIIIAAIMFVVGLVVRLAAIVAHRAGH